MPLAGCLSRHRAYGGSPGNRKASPSPEGVVSKADGPNSWKNAWMRYADQLQAGAIALRVWRELPMARYGKAMCATDVEVVPVFGPREDLAV